MSLQISAQIMNKILVLFVCSENICRSPMAQGIMESLVQKRQLSKMIKVDSAGTIASQQGQRPDHRTISVLGANGINPRKIRSRRIKARDFHRYDYILGMDSFNLEQLLKHSPPEYSSKIHLVTAFGPDSHRTEIPDPYFGSMDGFEFVYQLLNDSIEPFLNRLERDLEN